MTLHETSPKGNIYFLEPNETERTVIHSKDDIPKHNLEKNYRGKKSEIQLSTQLSKHRWYAYSWSPYPRRMIADSSNGVSYLRKTIVDSSNGVSYSRKPIADSSNGVSYSRNPILKNSLNGAGNSKKTNEDSSNKERLPKKVTFQDYSNGKSCHSKTTESNGQSYTENIILESTNNENCYNGMTIKGSSRGKQPLRDASNSKYNDFYRNLDTTIINHPNSSVKNLTSAHDYNSDDTLVGHSFSLFFKSKDQTDEAILLTSTPKGKRKSDGAKSSILKDTKPSSFCKETLSKVDHRLESIKSCLKTDCKIVDHEVSSAKLFNSFGEETLSKANLRVESVQSCVRIREGLDQPTSNISWYLNTGFLKRPRKPSSTIRTRDRDLSAETNRDFLNFERRQLEAVKDIFSDSIVTEILNEKTARSPFFLKRPM